MGTQELKPLKDLTDTEPGDRREWILRLLYAPDHTGEPMRPITGRTRMMKLCFLLDRKLDEKFDQPTDFDFGPHKFGPFDEGVYAALVDLNEDRHLDFRYIRGDEGNQIEVYELRGDGAEESKDLYDDLDSEMKRLLKWIREEQETRPLGSLLSYVYSQYPHMTSESEIKHRVG